MYSFCIYDAASSKIHIVRDRVGIKPLYYSNVNGQIAWASELKALETYLGKGSLEVDHTALYDFLTYLYIPAPKTLYKDIYKLEPAHYLEIDLNSRSLKKRSYWSLDTSQQSMSLESAAAHLRYLVRKSVKSHLISDVPLGYFLSGGIDSSVVVAEAAKLSNPVNTYVIGFHEREHDESSYAINVSRFFGTRNVVKKISQGEAGDLFPCLKNWYDEPFADTSALPTYLVSKLAREKEKVVLTGDGGDEIFGGYTWYRRFYYYLSTIKRKRPSVENFLNIVKETSSNDFVFKISNRLQYFILDDLTLYTKLLGGMSKLEKCKYAAEWEIPVDYDDYWYFRKFWRKDLPGLKRLQFLDFHTYLPDDILTKVDRASMAVSLEARVPLLSKDLVEFSFSLPEDLIWSGNQTKGLLKTAYGEILPPDILARGKKGFSVPTSSWTTLFDRKYRFKQEQILDVLYPNL